MLYRLKDLGVCFLSQSSAALWLHRVLLQEYRRGGTGEAGAGEPGIQGHFWINREFEFSLPCPELKHANKTQESEGRREGDREERGEGKETKEGIVRRKEGGRRKGRKKRKEDRKEKKEEMRESWKLEGTVYILALSDGYR